MATANIAPMKGANEKYAPVRAAPRYRNANTNITRLTPTPRNPTSADNADTATDGKTAPLNSAKAKLTLPANKPLVMAVKTGSADDNFRVIPTALDIDRCPCSGGN